MRADELIEERSKLLKSQEFKKWAWYSLDLKETLNAVAITVFVCLSKNLNSYSPIFFSKKLSFKLLEITNLASSLSLEIKKSMNYLDASIRGITVV